MDLAERERSCLTLVELDLDSAAGAICTTRATLTAALAEGGRLGLVCRALSRCSPRLCADVGQGLEAESAEADIYAPLRALFDTTQSTKVQSRCVGETLSVLHANADARSDRCTENS